MPTLWLDFETYNVRDISVGTYRYAETAEVLLAAYALDDGPVYVWDAIAGTVQRLDTSATPVLVRPNRTTDNTPGVPADLAQALADDATTIVAHNAQFDRLIAQCALGIAPRLERWRCTMMQAYSHAYPGSLDVLCKLLDVPTDQSKLAVGKKLINRFCKPAPAKHKTPRYNCWTHPVEWDQFALYAALDIVAMREVARRLPTWNWRERDIAQWHRDQRINDRGLRVDRELVAAGARAAETERAALADEFVRLTDGHVTSPTQREAFRVYLNARFGLTLDNTRRDTLQPLVDSGELDPTCARLIQIALLANKTSTAKYAALLPALQDDDRFRGGLQSRGAARTRRYAGRVFQPQNLPSRGLPPQAEIDQYIDALKIGAHDYLFDDLMLFGAAALRGVVTAHTPDAKLAVADLANIEGRLVAWLADETWKLDAFRAFDAGVGDDLYKITAASIIGGAPSAVGKSDRNVFGKIPELAFGYQGGFQAAQTFAKTYGLLDRDGRAFANHLDTIYAGANPEHVSAARANWTRWGRARNPDARPDEWHASEVVKLGWRARHPATVQLWHTLTRAAISAIEDPGQAYQAGRWLVFQLQRHAGVPYLLLRLPSGAYLCYAEPRVHRRVDADGRDDVTITYMGLDATATGGQFGQWQRLYIYGGKFLENCAQSVALDVLQHAFAAIEAAGLPIVLTVHDEIICEKHGAAGANELAALMSRAPAWAPGLPLAAEGFETYRYRKG